MADSTGTSYISTFVASVRSVGTAVTLASVGVYLHQRNFVTKSGKRTLAIISQQVTFPLFLFSKIIYCNKNNDSHTCPDVAQTLQDGDVWVLLLWPLVVVGCGLLVGWLVARLTMTKKKNTDADASNSNHTQITRSVMAACAFGNSTGLPITLLTVVHSNFPKSSDLGRVDPTLFLSVYLLLYPVLQWGLGGWLLAPTPTTTTSSGTSATDASTTAGAAVQNGVQDSTQGVQQQQYHSLGSTLKLNVLNVIPEKDGSNSHYYPERITTPTTAFNNRPSRNGLVSMDEGLYISEVNLQSLAPPNPEDYQNQQYYDETTSLLVGTSRNNDNEEGLVLDEPLNLSRHNSMDHVPNYYNTTNNNNGDRDDQQQSRIGGATTSNNNNGHDDEADSTNIGAGQPPPPPQDQLILPLKSSKPASSSSFAAIVVTKTGTSLAKARTIGASLRAIAKRCLQPPVIGALIGIFVAILPSLRGLFVDLSSSSSSNNDTTTLPTTPPLKFVFDGLYSVGLSAVPINMMILGCNLSASLTNLYNSHYYNYPKSTTVATPTSSNAMSSSAASKSSSRGSMTMSTMIGIVIGKLIVLPCIGIALAILLKTYVWNIPDEIDGSFYMVVMIVFLTPTANNVMVMVELSDTAAAGSGGSNHGGSSNTKESIATVIALQYAVAPIVLSGTMTIALGIASKWS